MLLAVPVTAGSTVLAGGLVTELVAAEDDVDKPTELVAVTWTRK